MFSAHSLRGRRTGQLPILGFISCDRTADTVLLPVQAALLKSSSKQKATLDVAFFFGYCESSKTKTISYYQYPTSGTE
jgi:hypothetical protein